MPRQKKINKEIICDGPITKQHVETVLQEYFKTSTKLKTARGVVISKGFGFTSDVMRVDLEWDVPGDLPPDVKSKYRVIVKAPKIENLDSVWKSSEQESAIQTAKIIPIIHETECKTYKLFGSQPPVPIPNVYGYRMVTNTNPGLIVMEDMGACAGVIDNIATGLTLNQWRNCFECLADLHAWSLTTNAPWQDELVDLSGSTKAIFLKMFQQNAPAHIKQLKESYPDHFSHVNEDKVLEAVQFDNIMEEYIKYKQVMPDVFQHGDFHMNNILFNTTENGTLTDKVSAIVDWQLCFKGSIAYDMVPLSAWCVNHELRRAHEMDVLKHYYDRLKSKAGEKMTASFDQVKNLYQSWSSLNGLIGLLMVVFILNTAARLHEDETGWRKREILERWRACYDDAVKFYGWSQPK